MVKRSALRTRHPDPPAFKARVSFAALREDKTIIEEAFTRYGMPEIVNTDQGSQFAAEKFANAVLSKGVKLSMDRLTPKQVKENLLPKLDKAA